MPQACRFDPCHPHHVGMDFAPFRFFFAEKSVICSVIPPLSQKGTLGSPVRLQARSQRLTVATTFLRVYLQHEYLYASALSCRNGLRSIPIFLCRKISHTLRHSSSFAKGHIRVGYSVASALITPLAHYQPFASVPAARIFLWFGFFTFKTLIGKSYKCFAV